MIFARLLLSAALIMLLAGQASAAPKEGYGAELNGFAYPHAVEMYRFVSQDWPLRMAYMDLQPERPNGKTVVLLHGKNFCAATWSDTAEYLQGQGYRVIVPDQIGFCKSSKPDDYQFSFQQLAANTHALLENLGIRKATLIGHSMGGMLAVRYALSYPAAIDKLVLVNPIGLEDWRAKGLPPVTIDDWYERELMTNAKSIRDYEKSTYYAGEWKPEYEKWVDMLAGMYTDRDTPLMARMSAHIYDMIINQPVIYEFPRIAVPTLLVIGQKDNTAVGKNFVPQELRSKLGNYPALGREAVGKIPDAVLLEFPAYGHAPQVQAPAEFNQALGLWLSRSKEVENKD